MNKPHQKYIIAYKDTLQRIADKLKIPVLQLVAYHNAHCSSENQIRDMHLPVHLTEILLPPGKKEVAETMPPVEVELEWGHRLPMLFPPGVREYGIMIAIFNDDKVHTVKYETAVRWSRLPNNTTVVTIDKVSGTFINDSEPDGMADELAVTISSVIYPLSLIVHATGKCVDVYNYPEIKKRWESLQEKIRESYSGEWLERYLHLNDLCLQDKRTFIKSLRNDYFLHCFFQPLYNTYTQKREIDTTLTFPYFFNTRGVRFAVKQQIEKYADKQGLIRIDMNGRVADERSRSDLECGYDFPYYHTAEKATGSYAARYYLEPEYHTLESMMLNTSLELDIHKKVHVVISAIRGEKRKRIVKTKEEKKTTSVWGSIKNLFD